MTFVKYYNFLAMISILIVDDSNDKVANIIKVIREYSENIHVDIVVDFVTAQKYLMSKRYDLLILDINLPIVQGDEPNLDVGRNLLNEINRKISILSPYYIISITQYSEVGLDKSNVWQSIQYSPMISDWKDPLINLIKHINKTGITEARLTNFKPTVFVEGKTDEYIFGEAIKLFKPQIFDLIRLKSEKKGGAQWVARQIVAWAFSLKKDSNGYTKAVGLIDGDFAGKGAQEEINRVIRCDSVESQTFKVIKLTPSYARHIIPIKQKGLDLPVALEEMFESPYWEVAMQEGWLEPRNNSDKLLVNPENWNKYETSLKDHLKTIGLTKEENLFLNCFKVDCKEKFVKYILDMDEKNRKIALRSFEKIVEEIYDYFFKV